MTENNDPVKQAFLYRLRFSRWDPACWLAHLDLMRTFERSIRRAGLPVAYSHGFNPRPQLAFALPIGTGLHTEDDYFDMTLDRSLPTDDMMAQINAKLPEGLEILAIREIEKGGKSLMSKIISAEYRLEGKGLAQAAESLQGQPADQPWQVEKKRKKKTIQTDVRPLVLSIKGLDPDRLLIRVKAGSRENLRPDLFLQALVRYGGLDELVSADAIMTRTRLLVQDDADPDRLISPIPLDHED